MRFTIKQLLISVTLFGISFAAFAMSLGINSAPPNSDTATFVISGMAFGAAIGSLTRRPTRFGPIGALIGPVVFFIAAYILMMVLLALGCWPRGDYN